ncbi:unnamed protein product [Schistosoma margrebowiei]|uniref:Uncharacterized protein n=1 Tax=Schistosoma margrebowiei TaxID=48269 RepID=A0A3P8B0E3_9TREM|nr:unnamed protein product [Schistosoma margrebowiei]
MFLIPNHIEENVEYRCSCRYVCFQRLCRNVVWSCCFATLDLSDGHADFFNCWWANIDWGVHECCFDIGCVQLCWSTQELFELFYPPVLLLFNVGDYLAFPAFHWSFWFAAISREFLCCHTVVSHFLLLQPFPPFLLNILHIYISRF